MRGGRILVFHRAEGFVHPSIPDAVAALGRLGDEHGFATDATDDPAVFTGADLDRHDVVVFVHTSGDVVPEDAQRRALERYVEGGGGFVGIHAAAVVPPDVQERWPWFPALLGATFAGHTVTHLYCDDPLDDGDGVAYGGSLAAAPPDAELLAPGLAMCSWERATVRVEDPGSPAARGLVDGGARVEEWYGFARNPRPHVHVVAAVDEATYAPAAGAMGADHPIVWWHDVGWGRSVYTALGHAAATWSDDAFLRGVLGAIELATLRRPR